MFFFYFYDPYIAIIGDIKNSKKIKNRYKFQERLQEALNQVNQIYADSIASKFTITLGDEFQGLLHTGKNVMEIIQYIKQEIHPIEIRFGIGVGAISTEINSDISIGADGPGYYKARESVEYLKIVEKRKEKALGNIYIKIDGDNVVQELSINTIFKLMYSIEVNWTEKQREVINYILFNKVNQTEVAQHFNVTQPNIQQILAKGHYYAFKDAFDTLNKILSEVEYSGGI